MGFFSLFGKKETKPSAETEKTEKTENTESLEEFEIYSGMRVEVTTDTGQMLFVAKLMGLHGNKGELHQYSESEFDQDSDAIRVNIRGYSDREKKAIYMEGMITPSPKRIWQVEELTIVKIGNDRVFFRLDTNVDATATMFTGLGMGEKPCKLLNISIGGACIGSENQYEMEDKFLLKFRLLVDRPVSAIYCQVVRVIEKEHGKFEYGCRFLELTESDQELITQNIFAVQRQKRASIK